VRSEILSATFFLGRTRGTYKSLDHSLQITGRESIQNQGQSIGKNILFRRWSLIRTRDSESASRLIDSLLSTGRSCGRLDCLEQLLHNCRNVGSENGAVCNGLCKLVGTLSVTDGVKNLRVTTPAASRTSPRSERTAGTADDRLPMLRTPLTKPATRPVMGSVSTPCGMGRGFGAGAATGAGAGAGIASTSGAAAAKKAEGCMMRREDVRRVRKGRKCTQRE
jgi:hypothetical protein